MLKKYLIIAIEAVLVALITSGRVPPVFSWFILAWLSAYFYAACFNDSVFVFIASVPLFLALPLFSQDTMALWRPLSLILLLKWVRTRISWNWRKLKFPQGPSLFLVYSFIFFVFVGLFSLIRAKNPVLGLKQILYFGNIFVVGFLVYQSLKCKADFTSLIKSCLLGLGEVLLVGYGQLVAIFFVPLFSFWQWWAHAPIVAYYGKGLGRLLSSSNTWFSYYPEGPATLRMFSVFPDSHSFALFCVLGLSVILSIILRARLEGSFFSRGNWQWWLLIFITLSAIWFSGTRGVWLAAAGLVLILGLAWVVRFVSASVVAWLGIVLVLFGFAFPLTSGILSFSQSVSSVRWQGTGGNLMFKRVASSFSTEELSVKGRLEIWTQTLSAISRHPWLGVGLGNFPTVLNQKPVASRRGSSAHSLYLHIASETGFLGLVGFLGILFSVLWKARNLFLKRKSPLIKAYSVSFLFFTLWGLGYSMVDVVLLNDKVALFFAALVGILWGIGRCECLNQPLTYP